MLMRRFIKSAFSCLITVILLTSGAVSVSAQYYMNVVQKDGDVVQYLVSNIDSVYFSGQDSPAANYEYVDLGLSVKWATFNVGATKPEEFGDYYAWGETEPYYKGSYDGEYQLYEWKDGKSDGYRWSNYKWCKGSNSTMIKYCNNSDYGYDGFTDALTVLTPEDDVAHVKWGDSWRMPTKLELDELRYNCTWSWFESGNTKFNGVAGYMVRSRKKDFTDNYIFLPAAGFCYYTHLSDVGYGGYYWTSSLDTDSPYIAWNIYLNKSSGPDARYVEGRFCGHSVRPVCP